MTQATTQISHVIISPPVTANSKIELKTASTSMSISLKMSSSFQSQHAHLALGNTEAAPSAFLRRCGKWADEEYRQGYVEASIEQGVAWQIRANRKHRNLSQGQLAELMQTTQSGISRLEDPSYGDYSMDSLVRLAHAFDCALSVKFIPFSTLAEESVDLGDKAMIAESFENEYNALIGE